MSSEVIAQSLIGSSGTVVGSAMESAGHYLQSTIIDMMLSGWGINIALFIYLISLISAIIITALGGKYNHWPWFIIGPALFYFLLNVRTPSHGANWLFGVEEHDPSVAHELIMDVVDTTKTPSVSWVFARWNQFISTVIRSFVTVIQKSKLIEEGGSIQLLENARAYHSIYNLGIKDPTLQNFVHGVTISHCAAYLGIHMEKQSEHRVFYETEYDKRIDTINNELALTKNSKKAYHFLEEAFTQGKFIGYVEELKESYTCTELWEMTVFALAIHVDELIVGLTDVEVQNKFKGDSVYSALVQKFGDANTCQSLEDERVKEELTEQEAGIIARLLVTQVDKVKYEDVSQISDINDCYGTQVLIMLRAMAIKMLSTEMSGLDPSFAQLNMSNHLRKPDGSGHYNVADDIRIMAKSYQYVGRGEVLTFALGLPYIQGVALCFFSLSFPLFAFTVIVPGRHATMMTWGSLWCWVKSWDFGFALIMVCDRVLYNLLPNGPAMSDKIAKNPGEAFQLLFEVDPTYSVDTYYTIIAGLMGAVPIATGFCVKRGTSQVTALFGRAYKDFGGPIGDAFAMFSRQEMSQVALKKTNDMAVAASIKGLATAVSAQKNSSKNATVLGLATAVGGAGVAISSTKSGRGQSMSSFAKNYRSKQNRRKFTRGIVGDLLEEGSQLMIDRAVDRMVAKVSLSSYMSSLKVEDSKEAYYLNEIAVMNKYSNHRLTRGFEHKPFIEIIRATTLIGADDMVNDAIDSTFTDNFRKLFRPG